MSRITLKLTSDGQQPTMHTALSTHKYLSPFQVEKFTYLFNAFFDIEKNGLIEKNDIQAFADKLVGYTNWSEKSDQYRRMIDVLWAFYDCIKDQVKREYQAEDVTEEEIQASWEVAFDRYLKLNVESMSLQQWLNMWGRLCYGSAGISDFPTWVQLLPMIFFDVIDRDGDGILSYQETKNFYRYLIGINDDETLEKVSKEGYRALTASNEYKLNRRNYLFCFANFLLGKNIYGPGKYIFGVFDNRELNEKFTINYVMEED